MFLGPGVRRGQNWRAGQPVDVTTKTSPVSMPNVNQCRFVQDAGVIQSLMAPVPTNQTFTKSPDQTNHHRMYSVAGNF